MEGVGYRKYMGCLCTSSCVLRGNQAATRARLHIAKNGGACCRALQDVDHIPTMQQVLCLMPVIYVG
jgi:hypothetical protein